MLTLQSAKSLLVGATSLDALTPILIELGFVHPVLELNEETRRSLGFSDEVRLATIASGLGSLRVLSIEFRRDVDFRQALSQLPSGLARRNPHALWLVVAIRSGHPDFAIVCWSAIDTRIRVVSLIARTDQVFDSDAETLCALAASRADSDLLTHARWREVLGREAITRRFFRALERVIDTLAASVSGRVTLREGKELALICVSRLLFLAFLETKGWLDNDFGFLANSYARCMGAGESYHLRVLDPLFFGTLNTRPPDRSPRARAFGRIPFLNGGLFSRSHLEKINRCHRFSDEALGIVYSELLTRYRFTPREDSASWSDASIDPEILGKAFEALMASNDRKRSGAFYTPQRLVEEVTGRALDFGVGDDVDLRALTQLRLLDPACGSGAFLVHALERIAALRLNAGESASIGEIRRRVLMTSIFGVDSNPMAVWLCELRLWLSMAIESMASDPMHVTPLPNLDRHIRVGDSLDGAAFAATASNIAARRIVALRSRYIRASGPRKRTLGRALDRVERSAAIEILKREEGRLNNERREQLIAMRSKDLFGDRVRPSREVRERVLLLRTTMRDVRKRRASLEAGSALPFSYGVHFSDIAARGGFNVIVGNPPWVRLHNIPPASRQRLRREFFVYRAAAAWEAGAASANAGRGFSAQVDLAALFVERSCDLLCPDGVMSLILPGKLWRSLAGGGVRELLLHRTDLLSLEDSSDDESQFEAAVYPSMLVCRRRAAPSETPSASDTLSCAITTKEGGSRWTMSPRSLPFDATAGSPWLLIPPDVRHAFDCLRQAGVPFADSVFGHPLLGVKTGCNKAFLIRVDRVEDEMAHVSDGTRTGTIERSMVRPVLRGENLAPWRRVGAREYIVWPSDNDGRALPTLPPQTRRWLIAHHDRLLARTDLHAREPWWSLFRTECTTHRGYRVAWADFGLAPRAVVIAPDDKTIPLNTCYVAPCAEREDAYALAALLNGPLAAAWLAIIAEPARGGYRRFLGWTMSLLPLPRRWSRMRSALARVGESASNGEPITRADLLDVSLEAYAVRASDIDPLLLWTSPSD